MRGAFVGMLVVVAACGGSDGSSVLNHGIVQGQNQSVVAGATKLGAVTWQLAREGGSGRITLRRVVDPLLPPLAYAQGTKAVVKGSPVPGAVVCATEGELKPFVPCTNTDGNGMATFFYDVKTTKAGDYASEIRGTLNGQPAAFDTAKATVLVGPVDPNLSLNWTPMQSPAALYAASATDVYQNNVPFRLVSDGRLKVLGTTVGTADARTVTFDKTYLDSLPGVLEMRGDGDVLLARVGYRFGIESDQPSIWFRVRGLNLTP